MRDIAARQIGTPSKPVNLKPRSQHRGRPRKSLVDKQTFNDNWDRIFNKDKAE